MPRPLSRRGLLGLLAFSGVTACTTTSGGGGTTTLAGTTTVAGGGSTTTAPMAGGAYGLLDGRAPDANGVILPEGFSSRIVATVGQPIGPSGFTLRGAPDGAACFSDPANPGGWFHVVNHEIGSGGGGVTSIRHAPDGSVTDAFSIASGTSNNCAGGRTPWGTWLSGQEFDLGEMVECDPTTPGTGTPRPALGRFRHEAAAVDAPRGVIYLTEDLPTGRFYRFTPTHWPDLGSGSLEAAKVDASGVVTWLSIPDPTGASGPTSAQRPETTIFHGGEGLDIAGDAVWFTTKGDDNVWRFDIAAGRMASVYHPQGGSVLTGVDNLLCDPITTDLWVAEDGGNMELCLLEPSGEVSVFCRLSGHDGSEVTGPCFSPDGTRLYFSSQRGINGAGTGLMFEITGPFHGR